MYKIVYVKNLHLESGQKVSGHCDVKPFRLGATIYIDYYSKNRDGVIAHELEHYKQHLMTLTLFTFLYKLSDRFKLWSEVKAYKKQLEHSEDKEESALVYATNISNEYGLDISSLDAYNMLVG